MEVDIIEIGNSKGIRLPLAILKQCGIDSNIVTGTFNLYTGSAIAAFE
ncbi:AbrB/MazE/SpoVT family DNA-binding domain-containing protein [Desulfoscipio gibsoniae]|nr:hypothetical protein [Desulfoscipio gibsoniae]